MVSMVILLLLVINVCLKIMLPKLQLFQGIKNKEKHVYRDEIYRPLNFQMYCIDVK